MAQSPREQPADAADLIDGPALARAFGGAAAALEAQRAALDAINVFPVPDGDTGTNMSLTMRAAADDAGLNTSSAASVTHAAAQAALMGARGNSGVILSQILSGLATIEAEAVTGADIAEGLSRGRESAYRVISNPREGTILTAISAASAAARASSSAGGNAISVLEAAATAAQEATDRTPELLPVLKEAGVVDAGAQGLAVLLDGIVRALRGEEIAPAHDLGAIDAEWLRHTRGLHEAGEQSGFCTEFVISGERLDRDAIIAQVRRMGDSVLVVGEAAMLRVHLHTPMPDDAIAYGRTLGHVTREKVEDMEAQFRMLSATPVRVGGIAVVAVGAGEGIEALFRSLGASVVRGGQTMNPSAGQIGGAIAATGSREVIVLPNNKNIVLAAEQAARAVTNVDVRVLPSRSIPQGVAALVALNTEASLDDNVAAMADAIASVHTAEVTLAARASSIGEIPVRKGQPIGLVDGELTVAEDSIDAAARSCVAHMLDGHGGAIVTLFAGEGQSQESAETLAESLRAAHGCEVEVVEGGQPQYPYLIGVE
jgi:DAK2 domain fusion protein YloV